MSSLYELTVEAKWILDCLEFNAGELTPEMELDIAAIMSESKEKMIGAVHVRQLLSNRSRVLREEIARLKDRDGATAKQSEKLNSLINSCLETVWSGKLETDFFTLYQQQNPPSHIVETSPDADLSSLPDEFVKKEISIRHKAVIDLWKQTGKPPAGFTVQEIPGKKGLRVR